MGQSPTQGPNPRQHEKQPAPLMTSAWEWWTSGYFHETPSSNGITEAAAGVSSWIGKIQGIEYSQSNGTSRPSLLNTPARGFNSPSIYFDTREVERLEAPSAGMEFLHNGTGGTMFIICASGWYNAGDNPFTNGGRRNPVTMIGFALHTYENPAGQQNYRVQIGNGAEFISVQGISPVNEISASAGYSASYSTAAGCSVFHDGDPTTVNSAELASPTLSASTDAISYLGYEGNGTYWQGHITDLVLWDRVLTAAEENEIRAWAKHRIKE